MTETPQTLPELERHDDVPSEALPVPEVTIHTATESAGEILTAKAATTEPVTVDQPERNGDRLHVVRRAGALDLETIADNIRLQAENEELRILGFTDDLTGLSNRRGFRLYAEKVLEVSKQTGTPIAFGMLDVDGLKKTNDNLGYEVGDELIKSVSKALEGTLRVGEDGKDAEDIVGRIGGDEFGFFLTTFIPKPGQSPKKLIKKRTKRIEDKFAPIVKELGIPEEFNVGVSAVIEIAEPDDTLDSIMKKVAKLMKAKKIAKKEERKAAGDNYIDDRLI